MTGISSILSLEGIAFGNQSMSSPSCHIDFELVPGQVAVIEVESDNDAASLVDVCAGLVDPLLGAARFVNRDWRHQSFTERLAARGRIGCVVQSQVWPATLSIAESVLAPRLHHDDHSEEEITADATALARLFGLPGLPAGRRDATTAGELVRAACVRGFLGTPHLVLIQDPTLDATPALGVAMAQAIVAVQDRGGAVLWIAGTEGTSAARYVEADQMLRLGDRGLVPARRGP